MQNKILISLLLIVLTFSCVHFLNQGNDYSSKQLDNENCNFPKAVGFVNDFEEIIPFEKEELMTQLITKEESNSSNQIAIVTLENIDEYKEFKDYTLDLADYWGIGQKGKDNGILIAVSKKMRKIRVQVGDGLLLKLTKEETKNIIDEFVVPPFNQGNHAKGIEICLREIIKELQ